MPERAHYDVMVFLVHVVVADLFNNDNPVVQQLAF